jgi:hypothetical protein
MMIYSVVMFVIERASQIMSFVEAVINSITAIAQGAIGGAATWIENALGRLVPVVIGLLASLIGLGGIGAKIKEIVTKVGDLVWGAIRKFLKKAIDFVKKMWGKLTGKKDGKPDERTEQQKKADLDKAIAEARKYLEDEELSPDEVKAKLGSIKAKYKLTSLTLVSDTKTEEEETDHVEGEINPRGKTAGKKKIIRMKKVGVTFECDTNEFDLVEYQDQLSGQQAGLNKLKVNHWAANRAAYIARAKAGGSGRDPKGATAQRKFREQERTRLIAEKIAAGVKPKQAEKEVAAFMKTQAALHDPDQIAGGDPTKIKKLGSKYINSSIGSQWKTNVTELDDAVAKIPAKRRPKLHMNVQLKLKKT